MVWKLLALILLLCPQPSLSQQIRSPLDVSWKNVSFTLEPVIAGGFSVETVPAGTPAGSPTDTSGAAPEHMVFTLTGSYVRDREGAPGVHSQARLYVYPVDGSANDDFAAAYPGVRDAVDGLHVLMGRRSRAGSVPFLPGAGAKLIVARKKELRFRNGKGIGYIVQFGSPGDAIANDKLLYAFEGMTDDNRWYVSFVFPIQAGGLQEKAEGTVIEERYEVYTRESLDRLERLAPRLFIPTIQSLENLVRSLKVTSP